MINMNDPVYYKTKIQNLINQAKQNGLKIELKDLVLCVSNNIGEKVNIKI